MRECLLSAALNINNIAIPKTMPSIIIAVQIPIGNKSEYKNNNNPTVNINVNPIANATFSGNAFNFIYHYFHPPWFSK